MVKFWLYLEKGNARPYVCPRCLISSDIQDRNRRSPARTPPGAGSPAHPAFLSAEVEEAGDLTAVPGAREA